LVGAGAAAEFVASGGAAGAGALLVAVLVVTVRLGVAAGRVATRVARLVVVVRLWVVVAFVGVLTGAGSVTLVSLATGAVSVVAGGVASTGGLAVVAGGG
jgi:hypothetical protein